MPTIPYKNHLAMLKTIKTDLESAGITSVDKDSKARVLTDIFVEQLLDLRQDQQAAQYAGQIADARGKSLIALGESLGVPKRMATRAFSDSSTQNFMFYVESGTFGDINGSAPISLPAGTLLFSTPNANELNSRIEFRTTGSAVLPAASTLGFVSAEALEIGPTNNVGALVIRSHDFTNYSSSASRGLKVVNSYPVINGRAEETDEVYRYRILQRYNRILQNSSVRMQLQALDVPGVLGSRVEPGYFGIGTAGVIVTGPEWTTTASTLEAVQAKLQETKTPGMEALAVGATEVRFDFKVELRPTRALTEQEQTRLRSEINRAMLQYFRTAALGSTVDLDQLLRQVQRRVSSVVSFQDTSTDRVFKRVYVRKGYAGDVLDERERLVGSFYRLGNHEFSALGTLEIRLL